MVKPLNTKEFRIVNRHLKIFTPHPIVPGVGFTLQCPHNYFVSQCSVPFYIPFIQSDERALRGVALPSGFTALLWCAYSSQLNYKALIWSAVDLGVFSLQEDLSNIMPC